MRSIISITILTFREAIRSKLAIAVAVALILIVGGMPFVMKGDGSGEGLAQTLTYYTLILSTIFLFTTALWASAAAISSEAKSRTLQLARVKPLKMWRFWLGKWIGLNALFGFFLILTLLGVWLRINSLESHRIAYAKIPPVLPSIDEQIEKTIQEEIKSGSVTTKEGLRELRRQLRNQVPYATIDLEPGGKWLWRFNTDKPIDAKRPVALLVTFSSDSYSSTPLSASCYLRDVAKTGSNAPKPPTFQISNFTSREMRIKIPSESLVGGNQLELGIAHTGNEKSSPIMLQPRQGLFLLRPAATLEENLLRTFLAMLPILSLLIAIGLTFGALFSLPVALFTATGLIIAVFTASYVISDPDGLDFSEIPNQTPLYAMNTKLASVTTRSLHKLSYSAVTPTPIQNLANCVLIPNSEIVESIKWNGILLPFILMICSSFTMSRKELPE